jgi:hypothetical protein
VAGRIRAAGGVGAQTFTREAVILMHHRAQGIPRTLSVIADNALLAGFAVARRPVNTQLVEDVCRDLDLSANADPAHAAESDMLPALAPATPATTDEPEAAGTKPAVELIGPNRLITFDSTANKNEGKGAAAPPQAAVNQASSPRRRFFFFRATV